MTLVWCPRRDVSLDRALPIHVPSLCFLVPPKMAFFKNDLLFTLSQYITGMFSLMFVKHITMMDVTLVVGLLLLLMEVGCESVCVLKSPGVEAPL